MPKYKSRATRLQEAISKIEDGKSEIDCLLEEIEEWRDNMQGTNLENTSKYQEVSDCADELEYLTDNLNEIISTDINFPRMY
jgi:chromosome segregation ATPase